MSEQIHIFDRRQVRQRRDRAAPRFAAGHRVLHEETAGLLLERLADVKRDFSVLLDLGAHDGYLAQNLAAPGRCVVAADLSETMLRSAATGLRVVADEEFLPFAPQSFDAVLSNLSLHWVNDLPGALAQIRQGLKPDGLFLAALLGGQTLHELRACLLEAELALTGGVSPRLSPSIDRPTASALLQRAGFSLPVTDHEIFTLTYRDLKTLLHDLRGMGETNAHTQRLRRFAPRRLFALTEQIYRDRFAHADGKLTATFEVIFMHGWSPS